MRMEIDPVCGMKIEPGQAAAQSQYKGEAFYFCSEECKRLFDANPESYLKQRQTAGMRG